jgi:integrase
VSENCRYNGGFRVGCPPVSYFATLRTIGRLTQKQVINAKPPEGRRAVLIADGGGVYLQCSLSADDSVRRSWVFRYEMDGQRHELGLGPLHTIGLREARERARDLRRQILDRIDPLEARRAGERERLAQRAAQAKAVTFKECAEMYLKVHSEKWRNARHRAQWAATLSSYVYPAFGSLAVGDVDVGHVVRALEPIWRRVPETARRTRGRIEMVLAYATAAKFRHGDNPANWDVLQHLLGGKKTVEHHAALAFAEAPVFFAKLQESESVSCRALAFTILTAARTGEVLGAKWDEIDIEAAIWTVPAARMKSSREHRIPLSDGAVGILKALPRHGAYVFHAPGRHGKPLDDKAMLDVLYRLRPGVTVHGFRSSFRDWAAERTNYPNHVVEMALAHSIGSAVEKSYRRGDLLEKRRQLMAGWDRFLTTPIPAEGGDVVSYVSAGRASKR